MKWNMMIIMIIKYFYFLTEWIMNNKINIIFHVEYMIII
jgi:hypothetical protein